MLRALHLFGKQGFRNNYSYICVALKKRRPSLCAARRRRFHPRRTQRSSWQASRFCTVKNKTTLQRTSNLGLDDAGLDHVGHLGRHPRREAQAQRVRKAKVRALFFGFFCWFLFVCLFVCLCCCGGGGLVGSASQKSCPLPPPPRSPPPRPTPTKKRPPPPPPPHLFFAHSGLKWIVRQILPPRYILAVLPSSSGSSISGAVAG